MSFGSTVSGMLGLNNDFSPTTAAISNPTNAKQIQDSYDGSQNALAQQQAFLQALQGQNGAGNQSAVFGQMQGLASTLQNQANGTGANPAMAQLQQTTAQNVANQNALMAGQRGVGANAGMLARQAAMQGANTQQQSVGQGATMAAQQQIAAQQQLGTQQASMANLSGQQVAQQANATTGFNQMNQNQQQMLQNAQGSFNNTLQGGTNANNAINGQISASNQTTGNGILSGAMGALGPAASIIGKMFAHGGVVQPQRFADGGTVGPASSFAQFVNTQAVNPGAPSAVAMPDMTAGGFDSDAAKTGSKGMSSLLSMFGNSAPTTGLVAGGAGDASLATMAPLVMAANKGAVVPGQASVPGDSLKNDTVPAVLSPGEVVIPRHVMQSANPAEAAKKFVAAIMARQTKGA